MHEQAQFPSGTLYITARTGEPQDGNLEIMGKRGRSLSGLEGQGIFIEETMGVEQAFPRGAEKQKKKKKKKKHDCKEKKNTKEKYKEKKEKKNKKKNKKNKKNKRKEQEGRRGAWKKKE